MPRHQFSVRKQSFVKIEKKNYFLGNGLKASLFESEFYVLAPLAPKWLLQKQSNSTLKFDKPRIPPPKKADTQPNMNQSSWYLLTKKLYFSNR